MKQIFKKRVFYMIIILSIILFTFGCKEKRDKEFLMDKVIGVKIYEYKGDFTELFKEWKQLDEDPEKKGIIKSVLENL